MRLDVLSVAPSSPDNMWQVRHSVIPLSAIDSFFILARILSFQGEFSE